MDTRTTPTAAPASTHTTTTTATKPANFNVERLASLAIIARYDASAIHDLDGDGVADDVIIYNGQETFHLATEVNNILFMDMNGHQVYVPAIFLSNHPQIKMKITELQVRDLKRKR